jgi:hypothetical protein
MLPTTVVAWFALISSVVAFQLISQDASCTISEPLPIENSELRLQEDDNFDGIITVQAFLDSATCQKYRETPLFPSFNDGDRANAQGDLIIDPKDLEKIVSTFTALGKRNGREERHNLHELSSPVGIQTARHTYLETSTIAHYDHYAEGTLLGQPVTSSANAFVFLNTNPNAFFFHGSSSEGVPVVEGTLVVFDGSISHFTHVPSGTVHLLGPLNTKTLQRVGTAPAPGPTNPAPVPPPNPIPCNSTFAFPVGPLCLEASLFPVSLMVSGFIASLLIFSAAIKPNSS